MHNAPAPTSGLGRSAFPYQRATDVHGRARHVRRGRGQAGRRKRADYVLRYRPNYPIAVIEAKAEYCSAQDGVQQARDYAEALGLRFAYASNGREIIEIDLTTGIERERADFPTPAATRMRYLASEKLEIIKIVEQAHRP